MDAIKVKLIGLSRGGGGNLQPDKTATPTKQEQTVRPDPGYDGLRQVTVEAIPDQYADVSGVDAGAGDVRVGKVIVGSEGETIIGTMPPQKPEEIGHATPTEQAQTVTPTAGSVFLAFEVDAIPSEYADVSGVDATAADVRIGKIIVDAQGDTVTGEMEPQKPEQSKSVVPTVISQLVTPDPGYALSWVDVGAIPSEYADVSDVTATAGTVLTGSDFVDASGTLVHGACDFDADTSDADATAGQIEAGATAYVGGAKVIGTMPIRTTDVEISDLSPVAIPAGSYDGTVKARLADPTEVDPAVIKKNAVILGQIGTYEGADTLNSLLTATMTTYVNNTYVGDGQDYGAPERLFSHCYSLEEIEMNSMLEVPREFHNHILQGSQYPAHRLRSASYRSATKVNTLAFRQCSLLETVDLDSCVEISDQAFESAGTTHGMTVNMPNCTTLRLRAFWNSGLTAIDMPSITAIANTVPFQGCFKLTSVNLPNLVSIGSYYGQGCFQGCTALTLIDLPKVTSISGAEWQECTNLATIILRSDTVCTLGGSDTLTNSPFAANKAGGTLFVPQNLVSQYENATNWSVVIARNPLNQILPIEGSPYEVMTDG